MLPTRTRTRHRFTTAQVTRLHLQSPSGPKTTVKGEAVCSGLMNIKGNLKKLFKASGNQCNADQTECDQHKSTKMVWTALSKQILCSVFNLWAKMVQIFGFFIAWCRWMSFSGWGPLLQLKMLSFCSCGYCSSDESHRAIWLAGKSSWNPHHWFSNFNFKQ